MRRDKAKTFRHRRRLPKGAQLLMLLAGLVVAVPPSTGAQEAAAAEPEKSAKSDATERASTRATPGVMEGAFLVGPGDQLQITIMDQPDMSGSYSVDATGTLSMPLLGGLETTGLTLQEVQQELTARFADGYLQNPLITVRRPELRAVTVVGGVAAPGRYGYMNGMSVGMAVSLAGGLRAAALLNDPQQLGVLESQRSLIAARIEYFGALAHRARLNAQLRDAADIEVPQVDASSAPLFERLVESERQLMRFEVSSQASQLALLKEQASQQESAVRSFEDQIKLENEQIAFIDGQISDLQNLFDKGLTRKTTLVDLQREKSRSRANLSALLGELERARSALAEIGVKTQDQTASYRTTIMRDLQATDLKIAASERTLPLIEAENVVRGEWQPAMSQPSVPALTIARYQAGAVQNLPAQADTLVWPGDIVQVGSAMQLWPELPSQRKPASPAGAPGNDISSQDKVSLR